MTRGRRARRGGVGSRADIESSLGQGQKGAGEETMGVVIARHCDLWKGLPQGKGCGRQGSEESRAPEHACLKCRFLCLPASAHAQEGCGRFATTGLLQHSPIILLGNEIQREKIKELSEK